MFDKMLEKPWAVTLLSVLVTFTLVAVLYIEVTTPRPRNDLIDWVSITLGVLVTLAGAGVSLCWLCTTIKEYTRNLK